MRHRLLPVVLVVAAITALLVPSATGKFRISTTIQPTRPVAGSPSRWIVRTEIALAREHGILLDAVGPWRRTSGQATFEVRRAPVRAWSRERFGFRTRADGT